MTNKSSTIGTLSGVLELKKPDGTVQKITLTSNNTEKQNKGDTPHGNTSTSNNR